MGFYLFIYFMEAIDRDTSKIGSYPYDELHMFFEIIQTNFEYF